MSYLSVLREYFGYDDFRGIQREIIESIGAGRDTLGLMPTGGGKSITFQVPALAQEGICIVISPLVALMKEQAATLRRKGIKATAIYSGMTHEEVLIALENCIYGNYKFLYVSPERLGSELFQVKLSHMHVSFIAVDEATTWTEQRMLTGTKYSTTPVRRRRTAYAIRPTPTTIMATLPPTSTSTAPTMSA